ncbi:hypothetical protein JMJ77_0011709 [Colletotrichum scovillei]|uniref:Uncharacterized protein n=1 Tax=Colletotrichum scovillei TaxID=1209932 RepID=A0A9P7UDB0_9PEZI|nr:hypothetical protein JMJ77_0011709 [Colletotrichum scovillei]KAG7045987.1 hypothetical protein JMJ78_0011058 [Colletotrichum scovillei]KAG7063336.1 hypothetical protein JMJ76_0005804 [Colletotrichum scovillei]
MPEYRSQEKPDVVAILATSQRIEFERCLAEIKGRNGGNRSDTMGVLQRLASEAEDASSILLSLQAENIGGSYDMIHRMLAQQTLLIKTQLLEVAGEMGKPFLPTPMSNPRLAQQSMIQQQQQQQQQQQTRQQEEEDEHQKPPSPLPRPPRLPKVKLQFNQLPSSRQLSDTTPTLDTMDRSQPSEKQKSPIREIKGFPPRITRRRRRVRQQAPAESGGRKDHGPTRPRGTYQGGSVRRHDQATLGKPHSKANEERDPLSRRKPGDVSGAVNLCRVRDEQEERIDAANVEKWTNDLDSRAESKDEGETKMEVERGKGSKTGDEGQGGETRGRKRSADNDLSPLTIKKPRSEPQGGKNGGSPGRLKRDAEPTAVVPSVPDSPKPVGCYIFPEALNPRHLFGTGKEDQRALHYRDAIEELIQLVEDAPHAITSDDPLMREYHARQFKEIQTVLRKIPSKAISKKMIDDKLLAIRTEEKAIQEGKIPHLRGKKARAERELQLVQEKEVLHLRLWACNELNDKIFAFGEVGAAIFANWIVEMKLRVEGELEFAERALMMPYLGGVQEDGREFYCV